MRQSTDSACSSVSFTIFKGIFLFVAFFPSHIGASLTLILAISVTKLQLSKLTNILHKSEPAKQLSIAMIFSLIK